MYRYLIVKLIITTEKLSGYLCILEQTYPGSILKLERNKCDKLLYAFVVLEACIRGWEYRTSILVVDGASLRGSYDGIMLTTSTLDPEGIFLVYIFSLIHNNIYDIRCVFNLYDFLKK